MDILGKKIERVYIIDDEASVRASYEYPVEELDLIPIPAEGPLPSLQEFVASSMRVADAVICDFQLRIKNYASFNGAETVAMMYKNQLPAVLCTRYEQENIDEMRRYRKYIPVLLKPNELDPESITSGFEACIKEFNKQFSSERKPWRTLIRIDDLDENENGFLYVVIPAWDQNQIIRLYKKDLPIDVRNRLERKSRFHAFVNIGAESGSDIFFDQWEPE